MKIAISLNICVGRPTEEAMIARIAKAGFDGIDFNFCDLLDRLDWTDEAAADGLLDSWAAAAAENKLPWLQGHGPLFNHFGASAHDQKARRLCIPSIRAAGRLGVPWLVLHPDVFPGAFDAAHRKAVREANVAFFRELLPACEKYNVGIAIENMVDAHVRARQTRCPRCYGGTPEELCELIDALNHPLIGACWDTGHGHMMGHDPQACIAAVGHRLKALHIQENDSGSDDHLLPYSTTRGVDWQGVMRGLRQANYAGSFTYEAHNGIRAVPDGLLDDALSHAARIARHICTMGS